MPVLCTWDVVLCIIDANSLVMLLLDRWSEVRMQVVREESLVESEGCISVIDNIVDIVVIDRTR